MKTFEWARLGHLFVAVLVCLALTPARDGVSATAQGKGSIGVSKESSAIEGLWAAYVGNGEHGPTLEIYEFRHDGGFRIIVCVLPGKEGLLPADSSYSIEGKYRLSGTKLQLTEHGGASTFRDIEARQGMVFLKIDEEHVTVLQRIHRQ